MPLLLCGIDEAGYGPLLGPLCVGCSLIRLEDWSVGERAPDLWKRLSKAVSRTPGRGRRPKRIAIGDSKRLKLANSSKTRHPLFHLERGVLGCLHCAGDDPRCDESLHDALGCALDSASWYEGDPIALPVAHDQATLAIEANTLARATRDAGIEILGVSCAIVGESSFNETVRREHSKAACTAGAVVEHMRRVIRRRADEPLRIVCDRQSGRSDYLPLIERLRPGAVRVLEQSGVQSRYAFDDIDTRISFVTEAEEAHLPVALASMTAKYVRELAMARFNRYWCARIPELKPTAGYVTDARRWLDEAGHAITDDERRAMMRIA